MSQPPTTPPPTPPKHTGGVLFSSLFWGGHVLIKFGDSRHIQLSTHFLTSNSIFRSKARKSIVQGSKHLKKNLYMKTHMLIVFIDPFEGATFSSTYRDPRRFILISCRHRFPTRHEISLSAKGDSKNHVMFFFCDRNNSGWA